MSLVIYHNPRCSKSRQTLALIEESGKPVEIVEYLKNPPSTEQITQLVAQLGVSPRDILRNKEAEYKEAGLDDLSLSDAEIIERMNQYPKVIERPIVSNGEKAVVGRPPENVQELL